MALQALLGDETENSGLARRQSFKLELGPVPMISWIEASFQNLSLGRSKPIEGRNLTYIQYGLQINRQRL